MNKFKLLAVLLTTLFLISCGGGGSDGCSGGSLVGNCNDGGSTTPDPTGTTTPGAGAPDSIEVFVGSTDLFTDVTRQNVVDVFAIVTDSAGTVLEGVIVTFSASNNASITVIDAQTDAGGLAFAELNNGTDLSNRSVTVTATVNGTSISNTSPAIAIQGTSLTLSGGTSVLTAGESTDFVAVLSDSLGQGIENATVTVSSSGGYNASADSTTGVGGIANVQVTGVNAGAYTLDVSALGETASFPFTITNDQFQFTSPAPGTEINIGANQQVDFLWVVGVNPQVGQPINFSTTRGTITPTANTNGSGVASAIISSTDAGVATIVATDPVSGITNSLQLEFVAVTADSLTLKTEKTRVDVGEQTNVIATVKDPAGNRVKNKLVTFSNPIDNTSGQVFPATAVTDSNGEARTVYTGGDVPSATDGVTLYAEVTEVPALVPSVNDTTLLTVAGVARDVTIGTGNTLFEIGTALYAKEFAVIVKDGVGNAKPGAQVEVSLLSERFIKGQLITDPFVVAGWFVDPTPGAICANEDLNVDGVLDTDEDDPNVGPAGNGNGRLDPGNRAVVAAVDPSAPADSPCSFTGFSAGSQAADVVTNANGLARVCIYYLQSDALWVEANIEARTQVSGTEFQSDMSFVLPVSGDDVEDETVAPPNQFSPFGVGPNCRDTL